MNTTHIVLIGWSHENAPIAFRDKVALNSEHIQLFLYLAEENKSIGEIGILSTCNRTEFYGLVEDPSHLINWVYDAYQDLRGLGLRHNETVPYSFQDEEAVEHLFSVSAGMKSMILGENQILAQVKDALEQIKLRENKYPVLHHLFQDAIRAGKAVRSQTALCEGAVSISLAAVELGKKIFRNFEKRKILIIGAGETAELTALHFQNTGGSHFMIANRSEHSRAELASRLNGTAHSLEELNDILPEADVVVAATGSPDYLLSMEMLKNALKVRRYSPILLIDISSPRNIDPAARKLNDIFLYDIDNLDEVVNENLIKRKNELPAAAKVIAGILEDFTHWWKSLEIFPTISDLNEYFRSVQQQELDKFKFKVNADTMDVMEKLSALIIKKLLHYPIINLRKMANGESIDIHKIRTLRDLFELDEFQNNSINKE